MYYNESEQKQILREIEDELLALLAIDTVTNEYEVIYSDEAFRDYENQYHRKDFFEVWKRKGMAYVYPPDRETLARELDKDHLLKQLETDPVFVTSARFFTQNGPAHCRIKAVRSKEEPQVLLLSVRNIDREIRLERKREAILREKEAYMITLQETLKQLQMQNFIHQMRPHFLYNALSSIREIVLTDPDYGAELLYSFTVHLRAAIRAMSNDELIPFDQEMENVQAYVSIEQMRFGDRLQVVYDLGAEDFSVIPLCVQPLVENAVKHGLYEKEGGNGTVAIRTRETADTLEIVVEDDGVGFDPEAVMAEIRDGKKDSTGLKNLIFRLENRMDGIVEIKSAIGKGTKVILQIPKRKR